MRLLSASENDLLLVYEELLVMLHESPVGLSLQFLSETSVGAEL